MPAIGGLAMGTNNPRILAALSMLRILNDRRCLERVLKPIGEGINESSEILEDIKLDSINERYLDILVSEETWIIENLLGAAFVTCQTHINDVTSVIAKMYELCDSKIRTQFEYIHNKNFILHRKGSLVLEGSGYTKIEIIHATANYFKHQAEWKPDKNKEGRWNNPGEENGKGNQTKRKMNKLAETLGISSGSSGNLRKISRALGNINYSDTSIFIDAIVEWQDSLEDGIKKDLAITVY